MSLKSNTMVSQLGGKARSTGGLAQARAMYFGYYMAIGAFLPFINLYYERMGLSGVQIGTLAALPVLVASSTALFWGGVADALRWHRRILRIALFLAPVVIFMLSRVTGYLALIPFVVAHALFSSPIVPLLDSSALEIAEAHQRTYGDLRVWGAVGWSISTWLVGTLIENFDVYWLFYGYIVFIGLTFLMSLFQPPRRHVLRSPFSHGLRRLLIRREFLVFLLSIFLLSVTSGAANNFLSLYLDGIGTGEGIIGLAWTLASISEIPVMLGSGAIIRRISASGLLRIGFLAYALRWLLFSFISDPAFALLVQLMHGLSFGAFLIGGVTYINELSPEGLGTTAQAVFSTVSFGLGSVAGAMVGGFFYDTVGMMALFRILSLIAAIGLATFWLSSTSQEDAGLSLEQARDLNEHGIDEFHDEIEGAKGDESNG